MFKFKGISSKEMDVYVTEINNLIRKAPQRYEEIYIDGRDGAFFHPLGYSPIEVPLELTLMKPERIDEVLQWLDGTGWLEYSGRKTKAHIFSEVEPVRASTVRIIQVTIIRNPFWEKVEDDWEEAWGANLIKTGWDDFELYGFGEFKGKAPENVFEDGYNRNLIKGSKLFKESEWEYIPQEGTIIKTKDRDGNVELDISASEHTGNRFPGVTHVVNGIYPGEVYTFSIYIKTKDPSLNDYGAFTRFNFRNKSDVNVAYTDVIFDEHFIKGEWVKVSSQVKVPEDEEVSHVQMRINLRRNGQMSIKLPKLEKGDTETAWVPAWEDLPADEKPVDVFENGYAHIKILGKGLTRVRTWGGDSVTKLRVPRIDSEIGYTSSIYIKNLGKHFDIWTSNRADDKVVTESFENIVIQRDKLPGYPLFLRTYNNVLDFIASNPIIVEGDIAPNWQATSDPAIYNEGTATSQPLIKLEKGKDRQCEFEVNGTYFKFHFNDDDHVILDCEEMEATYNGFNRNRHLTIGFEWPKLKPKENFIKRISGDAKILFKRKDRWL